MQPRKNTACNEMDVMRGYCQQGDEPAGFVRAEGPVARRQHLVAHCLYTQCGSSSTLL
jgi:hypothetical protein